MTHWSTGVSSYVKRTPHKTIYGHKEKVCLEQNISIGFPLYGIRSFHASLHQFSQCFLIRQITMKASNDYSNVYSFGNTLVWIGLDDKAVESIFRWVSGHPLYYDAWGPVEPNLAEKENCAGIHDVSIFNAPCTWTLSSLCSTTGIESLYSWWRGTGKHLRKWKE